MTQASNVALAKAVDASIRRCPPWLVKSARLDRVLVSSRPEIRAQQATFEHGSRTLYISDQIPQGLIERAVVHELAHAADDNFGSPHYFSSKWEWKRIHQQAQFFDIPKYAQESLEYFADMVAKYVLVGPVKLSISCSHEVQFVEQYVIPVLRKEFGQ